jgi:hypothetical protein
MTMSPAEFEAFLHKDIAKWAQVAKTARDRTVTKQ